MLKCLKQHIGKGTDLDRVGYQLPPLRNRRLCCGVVIASSLFQLESASAWWSDCMWKCYSTCLGFENLAIVAISIHSLSGNHQGDHTLLFVPMPCKHSIFMLFCWTWTWWGDELGQIQRVIFLVWVFAAKALKSVDYLSKFMQRTRLGNKQSVTSKDRTLWLCRQFHFTEKCAS